MKALRGRLDKLNPKHIHLGRRGSKGDGDGDENAASSTPPAPGTPEANALSTATPPRTPSPALSGRSVSPGPPGMVMMKGPPPAGAVLMKAPVSQPGMKTMGQGSGAVSPRGQPPPGAKIMAGPPPMGAKIMKGPPPTGAGGVKFMTGPPPAGARVMNGPPPGAKIMTGPPQGAKVMAGLPGAKLPPGAQLKKGSPPPGAILVGSRPGSRPLSPEVSGVMKVPSGAVQMTGAKIPPGAQLMKMPMAKSPPVRPGSASPMKTIPVKAPPMKLMIKSPSPTGMRVVGGGITTPQRSGINTPQLVPNNASFGGPPSMSSVAGPSPPGGPQLLRPQPKRPAGPPPMKGGVAAAPSQPGTPPAPTNQSPNSKGSSLPIPHPSGAATPMVMSDDDDEDGDVKFEMEDTDDEAPAPAPAAAAKPPAAASSQRNGVGSAAAAATTPAAVSSSAAHFSSSSSSSVFKEEPDADTALPPPRHHPTDANSLQSSGTKPSGARPTESTSAKHRHHRRRSDSAHGKERRHRHHRHRSSSSKVKPTTHTPPSLSHSARSSATPIHDGNAGSSTSSSDSAVAASAGQLTRSPPDPSTPPFPDKALTTTALTPNLRSRIADQFLSILCPQQYYGKVKKIHGIRPIKADRAAVTGLRKFNSIYVATKGVLPNQYFFPQLRLYTEDGTPSKDGKDPGAVDTPIVLYEAAPGNMLFADTELEARRVLETNPNANSCFVLSCSSILFRDPVHFVLPVAMLNVRWTPYTVPQSEPQCPIHKKELQLFDPYSKELVCALCASKNDVNVSKLVVIPDVLSGDSRRRIHESVSRQLDEAQRSAKMWVGQHQRIAQLCDNRKSAIQQQFNLLLAAVEAKRKECMEACDAEYGYALSDVAREILVCDEKVQLLTAATNHLRTDLARPLYSMQIATIAEGLEASSEFPSTFTRGSLKTPALSTGVLPNLEGVMAELQSINPTVYGPHVTANGASDRPGTRRAISHSPYHSTLHDASMNQSRNGTRSVPPSQRASQPPRRSSTAFSAVRNGLSGSRRGQASAGHSARGNTTIRRRPSFTPSAGRSRSIEEAGSLVHSPRRKASYDDGGDDDSSAGPYPRKTAHQNGRAGPSATPRSPRARSGAGPNGAPANGTTGGGAYGVNALSVPNSTGTSLFDYPIQDLLCEEDESVAVGARRALRPRVVQWMLRVDDPGDWVGIGVGVGSTIESWERGRTNDLSHLWIVPYAGDRRIFLLRVTMQPNVGHAKLSIHDSRGKQLDDGSIPQWNASRVCYPQATFGGRTGQVRLIEMPHLV